MPAIEDPTGTWQTLPRRIYLDTSTLQAAYDHGAVVWENEDLVPTAHTARVKDLDSELECLRRLFAVNQRAQFEFVVTAASMREVAARNRPAYAQWVHDVLDTWLIQSAGNDPPKRTTSFDEPRFGNLSVEDRRLLQEALDVGCDAFLTMERRLPTAAEFIQRTTGLRVMRPSAYWALLAPWAALYR